jgi:hypothetical protein
MAMNQFNVSPGIILSRLTIFSRGFSVKGATYGGLVVDEAAL